jgi:hypothetical protein
MPEEPPTTPRPPRRSCPPRKRSQRPAITPHKRPGMAEAQRRLWSDPAHRAKMIAARQRTADERRKNPHLYSRIGIPDGMRKPEAMKAWDQAHSAADEYIGTLETKGIVASSPVPESDEALAKIALHELCKMALGPCSARHKVRAYRILLAYTKTPPQVRREIGLTAEGLLAQVQQMAMEAAPRPR